MWTLTIGVFFCYITSIRGNIFLYNKAATSLADTCNIDAELVTIDQNTKDKIVDTLNRIRNFVASGKLNRFNSASHMHTVTWDDELSELARESVHVCQLHRSSSKTLGETVGYRASKTTEPYLSESAERQFKLWFEEHKLASMRDILNNTIPKDVAPYNFLQLVYENATKVGCAAAKQTMNRWYQIFIVCNYNKAPKIGALVYNLGLPGKKCHTNQIYTHLCDSANNKNSNADAGIFPGNDEENLTEIYRWEMKTGRIMTELNLIKMMEMEEIVISTFNLPYPSSNYKY